MERRLVLKKMLLGLKSERTVIALLTVSSCCLNCTEVIFATLRVCPVLAILVVIEESDLLSPNVNMVVSRCENLKLSGFFWGGERGSRLESSRSHNGIIIADDLI